MLRPVKPDNEAERLLALQRLDILDSGSEEGFNDLVAIAAAICGMPMGAVTLIDADRQWVKAQLGVDGGEIPREQSFCTHAILEPGTVMVVPDTRSDPRFRDNPAVTAAPPILFYAGAPLLDTQGYAVGALCVMDSQPRQLGQDQRQALQALSRQVSRLLELRRVSRELQHQLRERVWYEEQLQQFSQALELRNADLSYQALSDPLTGLGNRRAVRAALDEALVDGGPLCLALLDLDHFKAINDEHGHVVGDQVLNQVGAELRRVSRDAGGGGGGAMGRYGGEEFAWLLPGTSLEQARALCEQARQAIAAAVTVQPVTVSIGVTALQPGDTRIDLIHRADQALYLAKRTGRNRVAVR